MPIKTKQKHSLLTIELSRAFSGRAFWFAVMVGIVITMLQFINYLQYVPYIEELNNRTELTMEAMPNAYIAWFGADNSSMLHFLFYFILPILSSLPFSSTYHSDYTGGMIKNITIRTSKKQYFTSKYIAVFISGGVAIVLPLIINFLATTLFFPLQTPLVSSFQSGIRAGTDLGVLFYSHPFIYVLVFIFITFIFAGLMATLGLSLSDLFPHRIFVVLSPFFICLFINTLLELFNLHSWTPTSFLSPGNDEKKLVSFVIWAVILIPITCFRFIKKGADDDIY